MMSPSDKELFCEGAIEVLGARVHNLREVSVHLPRNRMIVITGLSGSGKSSLAFDTIYAEGQRRYMETFGAYARQFIGQMERPDVEQITGLSPVISIEQKTTNRNPRSTVGTVTELYDFLRLLFARVSTPYSYETGKEMRQYTEEEMREHLRTAFAERQISLLAPLVRGRKGHYRELFEQLRKQGFLKVRVDGKLLNLQPGMMLDRFSVHDVELVVDRLQITEKNEDRLRDSLALALKFGKGLVYVQQKGASKLLPLSTRLMEVETGLAYEDPSPNSFSFNSPYGMCPHCKGLGQVSEVDRDKVVPDLSKTIRQGGIVPWGLYRENRTFQELATWLGLLQTDLDTPLNEMPEGVLNQLLYGADMMWDSNSDEIYSGVMAQVKNWYFNSSSDKIRHWAEEFMSSRVCPECKGHRLRKESLYFKIGGLHISQVADLDLPELKKWLESLPDLLDERRRKIAVEILKELKLRLQFLLDVGLTYLSLNRPARTLSGGESQRIRLATQIGSKLTGITYILDEPSIGLHQRDNQRLIQSLKELSCIGNTVIVVEHDKDIMLASDYIVDLGPGAGKYGGEVVGKGSPEAFMKQDTLTSRYLAGKEKIPLPRKRRRGSGKNLELRGARGHNLKNVNLSIPLGKFVCITGVSGSGKSSLINETLYPALRKHFYRSRKKPLPYEKILNLDLIDKVVEIDQAPIGRTPRSNPATYTGLFTPIRSLFSGLPESRIRGYKPGRFSFNVKGGRCEICRGSGLRVIEMSFLPDVHVECEACMGRRYNRETLEILYKGKSISEVLDMTVDEAVVFFEAIPAIYRKVKTLQDVGLGYITLGQQATTLSGGEAQRVKLAEELSKRDTGRTLYILDEPTTGLHFEDIKHLLHVLNCLVDKGNTVVVIEHNMDIIKVADHIIDLGPEGGHAGGTIVAEGTPEEVAKVQRSFTGQFLKKELDL